MSRWTGEGIRLQVFLAEACYLMPSLASGSLFLQAALVYTYASSVEPEYRLAERCESHTPANRGSDRCSPGYPMAPPCLPSRSLRPTCSEFSAAEYPPQVASSKSCLWSPGWAPAPGPF